MTTAAVTDGTKAERVLALMDERGLDTLILRSPAGIAWWSGGGRMHILATPEVGAADLVLRRSGTGLATSVVTYVNEAPRLRAEELSELAGDDWQVLPWAQPRETVLPTGPGVGSDVPLAGCQDVAAAATRLRACLLPGEVALLRGLGLDAAQALTGALATVRPADTEWHAAAVTAAALLERGIDPIVLLVAGGERLAVHRHPLPTGGPLGPYAMVVVCGRRDGLIVALTRFVGTPPAPSAERLDRLLQVDASVIRATRPGRLMGEVFADLQAAYVGHGFDDDEWTRHHQGGPLGYASRDLIVDPSTSDVVAPWQAFAWNPSAVGVKSEDTVLAGPDSTEVLTLDPQWPAALVGDLSRPLSLPYA